MVYVLGVSSGFRTYGIHIEKGNTERRYLTMNLFFRMLECRISRVGNHLTSWPIILPGRNKLPHSFFCECARAIGILYANGFSWWVGFCMKYSTRGAGAYGISRGMAHI